MSRGQAALVQSDNDNSRLLVVTVTVLSVSGVLAWEAGGKRPSYKAKFARRAAVPREAGDDNNDDTSADLRSLGTGASVATSAVSAGLRAGVGGVAVVVAAFARDDPAGGGGGDGGRDNEVAWIF